MASLTTGEPATGPRIFISAAEASADLHGASLIQATLAKCPTASFVGVAGPKMRDAGCVSIFDMSKHSAMLLGALRQAGRAAAMLGACDDYLRRYPFDAAVVIDSPTLHLPLAGKAHTLGVPVLYYVAPQMWAWGSYRIYKLRHRTTRVASILPFEEDFFRKQGVNARYVGHPLADSMASRTIDEDLVGRIRGKGSPVVALLPGSRKHVVSEVLKGQLEVALRIKAVFPDAVFGVSVAGNSVRPTIDAALTACAVSVQLHEGSHDELIRAADLVLVASGTTTLEIAFHEKPMIVMYNASRLFYHLIGRWMIHTSYFSLPNILAGRQIVPEFMPYYTSTEPIAESAIDLLGSEQKRSAMSRDLAEVVRPLREGRASQRTADMLLDMIATAKH